MHKIETFQVGDFRVTLSQDDSPDSPREWDNVGQLWCWQRRYHSPDRITGLDRGDYDSWEEYDAALAAEDRVVLPVYCYEHGGISYSTGAYGCPWDSGRAGVISALRSSCPGQSDEQIESILRAEVETYSAWANGEVYCYSVESPEGETVDYCCGFYGLDEARFEGRSVAEWHDEQARAAERMEREAFAL